MKKKQSVTVEATLAEINKALWRHSSFGYIFLHGVVRGVGTALGATVIVALITSLTLHFADSPHVDAMIQAVVESMFE